MARLIRLTVAAVGISLTVLLAGCTGSSTSTDPAPNPAQNSAQNSAQGPARAGTPSGEPSDPAKPPAAPPAGAPSTAAPQPKAKPTTADQPVPKVQRSKAPKAPTASAKPVTVDDTVRYADGVQLKIDKIDFAKETAKGPGSFPGRPYAVLTMEMTNRSKKPLSMETVIITVLDKNGTSVAPVYVAEAKVQDFSGTLKAGATAKARYAFAVPVASRSKVTVVVDFDGAHTSAVFRGKLS